MQNLSYENKFRLHEIKTVSKRHFAMNSFAGRFVFTLRQKATGTRPTVIHERDFYDNYCKTTLADYVFLVDPVGCGALFCRVPRQLEPSIDYRHQFAVIK